MTANEIIANLPHYVTHNILVGTVVFVLSAIVLFFISSAISASSVSEKVKYILCPFALISIVLLLSALYILITPQNALLSKQQIADISRAPSKIVETKTVDIVSSKTSSSDNTQVSGGRNYITGSTTNTTGYQYTVKTGDNTYQVKTLSDEYGKINPHDISIQEVNNVRPRLLIEKHRYTDERIRRLLTTEDFSGEWTTYTFQVPSSSVNKNFGY